MNEQRVALGKHVLDKGILDRNGLRCGKVDDLVLDVPDDGSPPVVVALVTGPLAFANTLGGLARRLARGLYHLAGVGDPRPVEVAWRHVRAIDVVVHLDVDAHDTGINALADAARHRFFDRIPAR